MAKFEKATVLSNRDVAPGIFEIKLAIECNEDLAGKFYMLKTSQSAQLLLRPISVYHAEKGALSFLIVDKGAGTHELHNAKVGETVFALGPSGNGFDTEGVKNACVVGGGIGVAPVALLAENLEKKGIRYDFFASYRESPYALDYVTGARITSESGVAGTKGMLNAILGVEELKSGGYDAIYACGPKGLLRYVATIAKDAGVKCYLCMERRMACGVGVCLGCTVKTTEGMKRCCKDGPVFDAEKVIWEESAPSKKVTPLESADIGVKFLNRKTGQALVFKNPIVASSGTFGFGTEYQDTFDVSVLGAICSKGLTLESRQGNEGVRLCETPSGLLNSIGLQNPGIPYFIEKLLPKMLSIDTVTIVNLSGSTLDDYLEGARLLQETPCRAIELNISCPNVKTGGAAFGMQCDTAALITKKIREVTDKFLIVKLTPQASDVVGVAMACADSGADAVSLCNSFSGVAIDIKRGKPIFARVTAGFGGPAVRPIAMRLVYQVALAMKKREESARIPIFAIGGVKSWHDVIEYIMAGASVVEVGTETFCNPFAMKECIEGVESFMKKFGYPTINSMRGVALQ